VVPIEGSELLTNRFVVNLALIVAARWNVAQ
jgi:hypothetical protein